MAESMSEDWFKQSFAKAFKEKANDLGRFNLAIFGKTGVGKSTLINAIFGEDVAVTGIGEPVTKNSHLYLHQSGALGVLDTRGLEIGNDTETIIRELDHYLQSMRRRPLDEQVHVAWYCVRSGDKRFEDTEADFIQHLDKLWLPVVLVLTQVLMRNGEYHPEIRELADEIARRDLPVHEHRAFLTLAKADDFMGWDAHGLQDLLDATFRVAPDGVASAITAAQKIDFERKAKQAQQAVDSAAAAAAAAGASPIPFSDAAILVPIQLAMMASISLTYDIRLDRATTAALAATAAATTAGRSIVTNLIKFVPGGGTIIGGVISSAVASGLTYSMGQAWILVCRRIAQGELRALGGALDNEAVRRVFIEEFKKQARKRMPGSK